MIITRVDTGNYYYGARYYDPRISVWLSVDPLAHKYPNLSPYVFVANNPIMLIDPDGKQIDIVGEDGNTTTYTPGMEYKGKDEFTRKTVAAYNEAYSSSSEAKSHIDKTVDTDNIYTVEKGSKNKFTPYIAVDDATGKESSGGGKIIYNPDGTDIPVQSSEGSLRSKMESNPTMLLLHETVHASRHEDGIWDGTSVFGSTGIKTEELATSHVENIIRSQMGLPLRTHYQVANMPDGSQRGTGFNLLKYKGGIISNYLWKSSRIRYEY